jgi:hypothetical protein
VSALDTSPAILVRVDRRLVELLLPGAIAEAEDLALGFEDGDERESKQPRDVAKCDLYRGAA